MGAGKHRRPAELQGDAPQRRPAPDRGSRRTPARDDAVDQAERPGRQEQELSDIRAARSPSPALREMEGPTPKAGEGEGLSCGGALTRIASLGPLSRSAGEGL